MIRIGDRGQIKVGEVYLYSHWGAQDLIDDVYRALSKKERWTDTEYLARIIFDEMKRVGEIQKKGYSRVALCDVGETGFGIGTQEHGDIWRLITIDGKKNIISITDYTKQVFNGTFDEFLEWHTKNKVVDRLTEHDDE